MKVKYERPNPVLHDGSIVVQMVEVEVTAADLIAEPELKRQCALCIRNGSVKCGECLWDGVVKLHRTDHFKGAKV